LLAHLSITTPPVPIADGSVVLDTLGIADVAILVEGRAPCPPAQITELICAAIQRGFPVVPSPGPILAITALVTSGLPAASFVYLHELPVEPLLRGELLAMVAAERRTLVIMASPGELPGALTDLHETLGERPLTVMAASEQGTRALWRGMLGQATGQAWSIAIQESCLLIVGGSPDRVVRWDKDRLHAEILARLDQDLGATELARQLAAESGWPRREIYRLVVGATRPDPGTREAL
jgi:16S rRNA (cytidine1402-2'-O)-methyltransferase